VSTAIVLGTQSALGTCFFVKDVPTGASAGTTYAKDTGSPCATPTAAAGYAAAW
jgi:hypothetical protein